MSRRRISRTERLKIFTMAEGICAKCGAKIDGIRDRWEISHEIPLALGGEDGGANLQPVHATCHRAATSGEDIPRIAKAKRVRAKHVGAWESKSPLPGGRKSKWKRKVSGEWVRRT